MSEPQLVRRPGAGILVLWLVLAVLAAMVGVGGGIFAVPILHYLFGLTMRNAVATAVLIVLALSSAGTLAEALRADSALHFEAWAYLVVGAVPGAFAGYRVAHKIHQRLLKSCFLALLLLAAARLVMVANANGDGLVAGMPGGLASRVVVVGFVAGFSSPLLGVGGGVLAIPGLLMLIPDINYLQARACSVAMTIVSSGIGSFLYLRAREARPELAAPFALLAVVGSFLGVTLVHQTGGAAAARWLLAILLLFLAGRFLSDVLRREPAAPKA